MLLVAAALAQEAPPPPVPVDVPHWETGPAKAGERLGRAGAWGVGSGLAVAGTGLLLMATSTCEDCFEPPAQWWIGLAGVGLGAAGVVASTPAAVIGPVIRGKALKDDGFAVNRTAGWASVGLAAGATTLGVIGAVLPDESPALGVGSVVLGGGALIAAGIQAGNNTHAGRPTALHLVVAPTGVGVTGQF